MDQTKKAIKAKIINNHKTALSLIMPILIAISLWKVSRANNKYKSNPNKTSKYSSILILILMICLEKYLLWLRKLLLNSSPEKFILLKDIKNKPPIFKSIKTINKSSNPLHWIHSNLSLSLYKIRLNMNLYFSNIINSVLFNILLTWNYSKQERALDVENSVKLFNAGKYLTYIQKYKNKRIIRLKENIQICYWLIQYVITTFNIIKNINSN